MANKEKKNVTVNISHLEEAFSGTDLSEFEPGETYLMSKLLGMLRPRFHNGMICPKLKSRGDKK